MRTWTLAMLVLVACKQKPAAEPVPAAEPAAPAPPSAFNDDALEKSLAKLEAMKRQAASKPEEPKGNGAVAEIPRVPERVTPVSQWFEDADGHRLAKAEQERTRAPLFIYVRTDWCPHCKRFDEALQSGPVEQWLRGAVKVKLNPEHSDADRELSRSLGVTGYPTMMISPGPGMLPAKVPGLPRKGAVDEAQAYEIFARRCRDAMTGASNAAAAQSDQKYRQRDLPGARADVEQALLLDPQNAGAWLRLARLSSDEKQQPQALGALDKACALGEAQACAAAKQIRGQAL